MDDDDEVQSHGSDGSRSPESPHQNRRIAVTVATAPPPRPRRQSSLPLALPISSGGGGGREDCWSEGATSVLIDAWGERYVEFSRGNLKQKHWKEVADIVNSREDYSKSAKTDMQCKNRIDTVKKKYKLEKSKIAAGGGPSKWIFYNRLHQLIGPAAANVKTPVPLSIKSVPMGVPVGVGSVSRSRTHRQNPGVMTSLRRQPPTADSELDESERDEDSTDEDTYERKRARVQPKGLSLGGVRKADVVDTGKDENWGNSVRELTRAILKFGEAYEQAESSKLQQLVEMEKQRMKFAKELELQRMQFFMKTQLELSQLKRNRVGNDINHQYGNNNISVKNHDSDSNE